MTMTANMSSSSPESVYKAVLGKGSHSWEDGSSMPRSPLAVDQMPSVAPRQRGAGASFGLEPGSRPAKPATLSNMPTARSFSGRQATERGVSLAVGHHRSPYPSSSKFFLTVVPPMDLPHDPPHPRSQASTSSSAHIRRGTLLPLYPTLGGQLYAISREYGLPSIGGLALYLCDDGDGNLGPRVGDTAWSALWSRFFDESADDLFQDITSPAPPQRIVHERDHSGTSSDMRSPYADHVGLRTGSEEYDEGFGAANMRPSSSMRRQAAAGDYSSPMAYHTPSPRGLKFGNSQSRSSVHTPIGGAQVRLPIVGRIEWAVDRNRALWWGQWIGEAEVASEKSGGSVAASQAVHASKRQPGRRSMHLASSLHPSRAESPLRSATKAQAMEQDESLNNQIVHGQEGTLSGSEDQVGRTSSTMESNIDASAMGYEPIEDQETHERATQESVVEVQERQANGLAVAAPSEDAHGAIGENQSYAGYSALLGVDDEARTRDGASTLGGGEDRRSVRASMLTSASSSRDKKAEATPMPLSRFNANILSETEEGTWRTFQEEDGERRSRAGPDRLSARSLSVQEERTLSPQAERGASAVHDWISKTQSPQARRKRLDFEEDEEEEVLLPPQDDVSEVIGLWAEKTRDAGAAETSELSSITGQSEKRESSRRESQRSSQRLSTDLTSGSPQARQSPPVTSLARLAELPEETPSLTHEKISKASLLSPIALDNSPGVFAGPSANLGSLLGGTRNQLAPTDMPAAMFRQDTFDSQTTTDTNSLRAGADRKQPSLQPASLNSLSSPRLELPSPRSPGGASQHSSSTEASDTLLDMERALALLSPAASNANHQSPAMGSSTVDTTYESGVLTSAVRGRTPFVSSQESMAKAKTLSTSVTPSPRWFRNTTAVISRSTPSASGGVIEEKESGENVKVSLRPASAFASTKQHDRLSPWDLQPPTSAARFSERVVGPQDESEPEEELVEQNELEEERVLPTPDAHPTAMGEQPSSEFTSTPPSHVKGDSATFPGRELPVDPESVDEYRVPLDTESDYEDGRSVEAPSDAQEQTYEGYSGPVQLFDSPLEDNEESENRWLRPVERSVDLREMGRQGWSETTGEDSRIVANEEVEDESGLDQVDADESQVPPPPAFAQLSHSNFSPRSGQYVTVGVQAEQDDQTGSVFSLVSDDAPSSEQEEREEEDDEADEGDDAHNPREAQVVEEVPETPLAEAAEDTPVAADVARLGHSAHSSDDVQPSIRRMIRGNSFAESSETSSSKATSPFLNGDAEGEGPDMQAFDWATFHIGTEGESMDRMVGQVDHIPAGDDDGKPALRSESVGDDATTARGAATSTRSDEGEEWSQDGSEYDDDDEATGSPSTRRSHMSTYSGPMGAGLSDAGGRTPTFFYDDHHLGDDEPGERRVSKRLSSNRRGSRNRTSQRLSRRSLHASEAHMVDMQDALGVGLFPPSVSSAEAFAVDNEGRAGELSIDNNQADVVSLAGDVLSSYDERMLSGFEQVAHSSLAPVQEARLAEARGSYDARRESHASTTSSNSSAKLQSLADFAAGATRRENPQSVEPIATTTTRTMSAPQSPRLSPGSAKGIGAPLRRSMGSVSEDRRDSTGKGRRASVTVTGSSPSRVVTISSPSPRRMRMAPDGTALPYRASASPSPKQRFRTLPPSPSLLPHAAGIHGDLPMSPTSPHFVSSSLNGLATASSPTSSSFLMRGRNPQLTLDSRSMATMNGSRSETGLASPILRGQTGTPTPPSPRGPRPAPGSLADYA